VIREAMRLHPPVTARGTSSMEDQTIGNGKYAIKKGQFIIVQNICAQRDPKVWGDDVSLNS
jgi:cytochrome P450/NADPH-cytochrome P450 reductase